MKGIISADIIVSKIKYIRGHKVMLDKDLAALYEVETKALNQAVARNLDRFPEDFMFRLSIEEFDNLKSQIVTSSWGGTRKPPSAFTEQGVAMLASVLNSPRAIQVNIQIIRILSGFDRWYHHMRIYERKSKLWKINTMGSSGSCFRR